MTADPAYDTLAFYGAAGARGARVVVPPTKTASLSRRGARSGARDRTIRRVKALGRRRWKKAAGYHQQARVENAFFRYKSIVGDCLRARSSSGQRREAVLACNVLNRMTELGRPTSRTASVGDGLDGLKRVGLPASAHQRPKIGPMWVRMLAEPGEAKITGMDTVRVAVDVQVRRITENLGVASTRGLPLKDARPKIQAAWQRAVAATDICGPSRIAGTCAALDPALWSFGKYGCSHCETVGAPVPIGRTCDHCQLPTRVS